MILPATYPAVLVLMFVCLLCWGSWTNLHKLAGKWRFELLYYDFTFGIALCAVIAAFTLGVLNSQELTFQDNFLIASLRKLAYGVGAGMLINLALVFFLGAVSVAGMGVTFPMSMAMLVLTSALWNYFPSAQANPLLLFGGVACLLASVVVNAIAYGSQRDTLNVAMQASNPAPTSTVAPSSRRTELNKPGAPRPASAAVAIILAVLSGIFMGLTLPLLDVVRSEENGVAPYGLALLLTAGIFCSTFLIIPFFMNFPVQGAPVEIKGYFQGTRKQHFLGIFGGIVWMAGTLAYLVAISTPALTATNVAVNSSVANAAALLGALWGLLVWRDFRGAKSSARTLLFVMLILYAAGAGMIAVAPLYGK